MTLDLDELERIARAVDPRADYYHDLKVFDVECINDFAQEFTPPVALELIRLIRLARLGDELCKERDELKWLLTEANKRVEFEAYIEETRQGGRGMVETEKLSPFYGKRCKVTVEVLDE